MRLFGKVNSQIDRFDRAEWMTGLLDLAFSAPVIYPERVIIRHTDSSAAVISRKDSLSSGIAIEDA